MNYKDKGRNFSLIHLNKLWLHFFPIFFLINRGILKAGALSEVALGRLEQRDCFPMCFLCPRESFPRDNINNQSVAMI